LFEQLDEEGRVSFIDRLMVPVFLCGAVFFAHGLCCWAAEYRAAKAASEHSALDAHVQQEPIETSVESR
jgi:hypothetical protein